MKGIDEPAACGCTSRRMFLADVGLGFTGLALGTLLGAEQTARAAEPLRTARAEHRQPKAKSVIWVFLSGGYSHVETFDPKPALNKYAGKTFQETPFPNPLESPLHKARFRSVPADEINVRDVYKIIYPLQTGWARHGQSGIEISDWWPHLATCVDDLTIVRSMYTTDNDHAAENQIHTGRHKLDETQPSVGAWATYGLSTLNADLPQFVVLGGPTRSDTEQSIGSYYLGPQYGGVPLALDPANPLPYGVRSADVLAEEQRREYELIRQLNGLAAVEYPADDKLRARIEAYELAFRMQQAVPEALDFAQETAEVRELYGLDNDVTRVAGERMLAARRLVERGVRFVQCYPSPYGVWDSHQKLRDNHGKLCPQVDQPTAALIKDLKRRGLLEDTVVVFCTEFGRTPGLEQRSGGTDGRDHHPHGFSVWLAGAGLKPGHVHGATDELGYHAIEPGHYVTDLHATVLHLLGLDFRQLEVPGRKRLDIDWGRPITDILA